MEFSNLVLIFEKFGSPQQISVDINRLHLRHSMGLVYHLARNGIHINVKSIKYIYSDTH